MMSCYKYIRAQKFPPSFRETFEQGLEKALRRESGETGKERSGQEPDILEIIKGNSRKAVFIPITPDIDVDALRQEWCKAYCKSHNYSLFDVSSPADFKESGGGHDQTS